MCVFRLLHPFIQHKETAIAPFYKAPWLFTSRESFYAQTAPIFFRLVRTYINEIYSCVLSYAKIADSCSFFFLQTAFLRFIRLLFHLYAKKSAYISASTLFVYKAVYSLFLLCSRAFPAKMFHVKHFIHPESCHPRPPCVLFGQPAPAPPPAQSHWHLC